ncbi:hypothetical protein AB8O64_11300 [Streptomyces sp. QH1-20]|uniref:hypothetical protein n=1 Tax=Streptomyces sp. QH1-20 TaxID=3240934 RepID=UPI003519114B
MRTRTTLATLGLLAASTLGVTVTPAAAGVPLHECGGERSDYFNTTYSGTVTHKVTSDGKTLSRVTFALKIEFFRDEFGDPTAKTQVNQTSPFSNGYRLNQRTPRSVVFDVRVQDAYGEPVLDEEGKVVGSTVTDGSSARFDTLAARPECVGDNRTPKRLRVAMEGVFYVPLSPSIDSLQLRKETHTITGPLTRQS